MKNLRNLKTPVFAMILGLGLVLSQSAFTAAKTTKTWVRDASGVWHEADLVEGECFPSLNTCSGDFENGIDPNVQTEPTEENPTGYPEPSNPQPGTFVIQ